MTDRDLAVTLTFAAKDHGSLSARVEELGPRIRDGTDRIDKVSVRAEEIQRHLGKRTGPSSEQRGDRPRPDTRSAEDWEDVVHRARAMSDDTPSDIDALLESEQLASINRRFAEGFTIRSRLDRYDIMAAVAAGITAALLDYLVVAVPSQSGLTSALKSLAQDSDNWLADIAKVPYDRVAGVDLAGFAPQSHRAQTFGHDPLLGWVYGTMDILRGSLTGVSRSGAVAAFDIGAAPTSDPMVALALQAMHLASDVITPAGLQLPGWSALLTIDRTVFRSERTVAELSRWMYIRGYDTWHMPTLAVPALGIEAVLRGYLGIRQLLDDEYREELDLQRLAIDARQVADLPRFEVMRLIARGVAVAGNAGRFALSGVNPLTLNFSVWLAFSTSLVKCLDRARPTSSLIETASLNRLILDAGWAALEVGQDDLPEIQI